MSSPDGGGDAASGDDAGGDAGALDGGADDGGGDAAMDDAGIDAGQDAGPCAACDDGIGCTLDVCDGVSCEHVIAHGECPPGQYCDPASGCRNGGACATVADCPRPDTCVTVTCNAAMARCIYAVLDGDADGHAPLICGGDDCDDSQRAIHGGAEELCDRVDQDCDGAVDEDNATTTACGDLSTCTDGACTCPRELDWCYSGFGGGRCVDVRTDATACGSCANACPSGVACVDGRCACPGGQTQCGYDCVDTSTATNHCGRCDHACPSGIACVGGVCQCPAGTSDCGGSCVDLTTSNSHCGACGNYCPAGVTCTGGECPCDGGVSCSTYFPECSDLAGRYCGACDRVCLGGSCAAGVCSCDPGEGRCESTDRNGTTVVSCVDLQTNSSNCGACGRSCGSYETCVAGECRGCTAPYVECTDRAGPHCVNTQTDADHCGACNSSCSWARYDWCNGGRCY